MTAKSMPFKQGFGPFAPEIYRLPSSNPLHDGLTGFEAAAKTVSRIEKEIGGSNVAAVVVEPVQGEGGFIVPAPGFLIELARYAKHVGALFIADEIQSGFCRTGKWFASEYHGIEPDLVTTAKGIAGGLPLSAVTGRAEVMEAVHPGGLGGTYTGNPIACAAALAAIDWMESVNANALALQIEKSIRSALSELNLAFRAVADIRGMGAMVAVEFLHPVTKEPLTNTVSEIAKECHKLGVVVLISGTHSNVVRFLPPLSIPIEILEKGIGIFAQVAARHLNVSEN